jgi:hypothetical protein
MTVKKLSPYQGCPYRVKVGPHTYMLDINRQRCADHEVSFGITFHETTEVALHPDVSRSQAQDTLMHELLHATFHMLGFGPARNDEGMLSHENEERLVRSLAPTLLDILQRNPRLVAYLTTP